MNKYLLSSLCLFALNNSAHADNAALTLPTGTITALANDDPTVSLTTPTSAGSRLNLSAMETPASVESLSGEQVRARGDRSVQDAVSPAPASVAPARRATAAPRCRPGVLPGRVR